MKLLLLGRGKTGALVADVGRERGHEVTAVGRDVSLSQEMLAIYDVVVDFTAPAAVVGHVEVCARARKSMVIGTTGWYGEMVRVRTIVEESRTALVWGGNFSVGMNLFYAIARAAGAAAKYGYEVSIAETHHIHKKDAPSGTAVVLRNNLQQNGGGEVKISSVRQGEIMGRHEIVLASDMDTITLTHEAKSRRGFAEGAVRASEWIGDQRHSGVYDFSEIFGELAP